MNAKYREYLRERIKEPSTWRGVAILLTGLGIVLDPDQLAEIASAGLVIAGAIGAITSDKPKEKPDEVTNENRT